MDLKQGGLQLHSIKLVKNNKKSANKAYLQIYHGYMNLVGKLNFDNNNNLDLLPME